jgi:hypothetical protein
MEAPQITAQPRAPGRKVVAEAYGLGALEVGVAGHDACGVFFSLIQQYGYAVLQFPAQFRYGFFKVKPEIQGNLIVPAPSRMDHTAYIPKPFRQDSLDKRVYIFGVSVNGQLPAFKLSGYAFKLRVQFLRGIRRDDSLSAQHCRVGAAPGYVLPKHAPVNRN